MLKTSRQCSASWKVHQALGTGRGAISEKDDELAPSHVALPGLRPSAASRRKLTGKIFPGTGNFWRIAGKSHPQRGSTPMGTKTVSEGRSISACAPPATIRQHPSLDFWAPVSCNWFRRAKEISHDFQQNGRCTISIKSRRGRRWWESRPYVSAKHSRPR